MSLNRHAEDPQNDDAPDNAEPEPAPALIVAAQIAREGEGNRRARHKDEEGHGEVAQGKSFPRNMMELAYELIAKVDARLRFPLDEARHGAVRELRDDAEQEQQEDIESSQRVKRDEPFSGCLGNGRFQIGGFGGGHRLLLAFE